MAANKIWHDAFSQIHFKNALHVVLHTERGSRSMWHVRVLRDVSKSCDFLSASLKQSKGKEDCESKIKKIGIQKENA